MPYLSVIGLWYSARVTAEICLAHGREDAVDHAIQKLIEFVPAWRGRQMSVSPLSGGLTNRNYRIDAADESFVLRVGGENTGLLGIDRACEHACSLAAAELGVGAEVVAFLPEHNALVTRFIPDRLLSAEALRQPEILDRAVASLRRYHDGPPGAGSFSPFATVRSYFALAQQFRVTFPEKIQQALGQMAQIEAAVHSDEPTCPCHNDLLAANLFDDGMTVRIIDWEYGGMGDRFFDLGNLAVNNQFEEQHELVLLRRYFGEVRSDHLRRLRLMRLASDLRESMWGFLQAGLSRLDIDYIEYGRTHLDRFLKGCTSLGLATTMSSLN
jgi:thiamine kinase-like enzyme